MNYNLLSFNLRCNTSVDLMNAWPYRKENVFSFLKQKSYDIIGFQEVTHDMYQELKEELTDYHFYGISRDLNGEAVPIALKKSIHIIKADTFWLTDTPGVESVIEGSACKRICTYVVFKNEAHTIALFNTHLDFLHETVIYQQSEYLFQMMKIIKERYGAHVILTGDFNQLPNSMTIKFLSTHYHHVYQKLAHIGLTFHGYTHKTEGQPIDYIFYDDAFELLHFSIIHHQRMDSFLSDHYPIEAQLNLKVAP